MEKREKMDGLIYRYFQENFIKKIEKQQHILLLFFL